MQLWVNILAIKPLVFWAVLIGHLIDRSAPFALEGSPHSYVRYPRWYHAFENELSFEFKTKYSTGLLLYTDDGNSGDNFYEIRLVGGSVRLQFRLSAAGGRRLARRRNASHRPGTGPQWLAVGEDLNDNQWHAIRLGQYWDRVKLQVDQKSRVVKLANHGKGFGYVFGKFSTNGDVFVGGVPVDLGPTQLSHPLVKQVPTFQGSIRNMLYRIFPVGVTNPHVLDSEGMRDVEDDYCAARFCHNGGYCYSTDAGPQCHCDHVDFSGKFCEKEKSAPEATFLGSEWLSYDFTGSGSGLISKEEQLQLEFKTRRPAALLFFAGDGKDYLHLGLENGQVAAHSNLGGGRVRVQATDPSQQSDLPSSVNFNDDKWHRVVLHRKLTQIALSVDGVYTGLGEAKGPYHLLTSTRAFVGGKPAHFYIPDRLQVIPFLGCLRKVRYRADGRQIDFLQHVHNKNGLINMHGNLSALLECREIESPQPITFLASDDYFRLPGWLATTHGTMAFELRTNEPDGLILHNGASQQDISDFVSFELVAGFLYFLIDLGSGTLRLKVSQSPLHDRKWHKVELERQGGSGTVTVDEITTKFHVPGPSQKLNLGTNFYLGGLNWKRWEELAVVSKSVWTASLRSGFIGCFSNLFLDGVPVDFTQFMHQQHSAQIIQGCFEDLPQCPSSPCHPKATCAEGWNRYICDCSEILLDGLTCNEEPLVVHFSEGDFVHLTLPFTAQSQAEDISIKFRTRQTGGLIFATSVRGKRDRMVLRLRHASLEFSINLGTGTKKFTFGSLLSDDRWHTAKVKRRANKIQLSVDSHVANVEDLPSTEVLLEYDSFWCGRPDRGTYSTSRERANAHSDYFNGQMAAFIVNRQDIFQQAAESRQHGASVTLLSQLNATASFGSPHQKAAPPRDLVRFTSRRSYAALPAKLLPSAAYNVFFQFRTLDANGLLLYANGNLDLGDFFAVELADGQVRYAFNLGDGPQVLEARVARGLNDLQWHSVSISKPSGQSHVLTVDDVSVRHQAKGVNSQLNVISYLFVGGHPQGNRSAIPDSVHAKVSFRGCLASLEINGIPVELMSQALLQVDVETGCADPDAKCEKDSCQNYGRCIQQWAGYACDCTMTSYAGLRCHNLGTTYSFGPGPGLLLYRYPESSPRSTMEDQLALGVRTNATDGVLFRVDSGSSSDYLSLEMENGFAVALYNLGDDDHRIGEPDYPINDGAYHVIRFTRNGKNATFQLDHHSVNYNYPIGRKLEVFNYQSLVQVGSKVNPWSDPLTLGRFKRNLAEKVQSPFRGQITGLYYNDLPLLDLAASNQAHITLVGNVVLESRFEETEPRRGNQPTRIRNLPDQNPSAMDLEDRMLQNSNEPSPYTEDDLLISGDGLGSGDGCQSDESLSTIDCEVETTSTSDQLITPYRLDPETTTPLQPTVSPVKNVPTPYQYPCDWSRDPQCSDSDVLPHVPKTTTPRIPLPPPKNELHSPPPSIRFAPGPTDAPKTVSATPPSKGGVNRTTIIAIVAVAVIIFVVIILLVVFRCRRKPEGSTYSGDDPKNYQHLVYGSEMPGNGTGPPIMATRVSCINGSAKGSARKKPVKEWFV